MGLVFPSIRIGLSLMGWGWRAGGLFITLRKTYIQNLSTLLSLEPLEKVPGGGWVVGGWWCLNPILVFSLSLSQAEQLPGPKMYALNLLAMR